MLKRSLEPVPRLDRRSPWDVRVAASAFGCPSLCLSLQLSVPCSDAASGEPLPASVETELTSCVHFKVMSQLRTNRTSLSKPVEDRLVPSDAYSITDICPCSWRLLIQFRHFWQNVPTEASISYMWRRTGLQGHWCCQPLSDSCTTGRRPGVDSQPPWHSGDSPPPGCS